ncbi:preprotein translocase subunit SecY [Candidatus Uhrbacteria bacterium RIFCSPHIGHO2_02_FULL_60_10]|uniref:Protein translocase subunit SecY n=1 Tax=Candidatus Uhrbacteria bacterium RIFCSPHIGHO2_02_FULL_60_10 TaxID=1802392 RepID=A0A1F7U2J0_9BACT|nr:MAG: preprotein translocase subunit SecY [Candidatus Uhrbacteria bacterium RIFCSPHIGHO2_02_FULL_60_10]
MMNTLRQLWKTRDLRNGIMFILGMLVVFRVAAHIPVPGVDVTSLRDFFGSNQIFGMMSVFSGGSMDQFSVITLGVGPYITASIIFQLLAMIIPQLEEMQREGGAGQERINYYTRLATVPLALLQGYAMVTLLQRSANGIVGVLQPFDLALAILSMTAGTVLLMWIGELISERKLGNGVSIMIFAGIVAGLPTLIQQAAVSYDSTQLFNLLAFLAIGVATVGGVVLITEAQRNVPVIYAKRMRGSRLMGGVETYLPLRVNMAGVIPIIFAISIILLPPMVAQFLIGAKTVAVANAAKWVISFFQDSLVYGVLYFIMVFVFTYFYTAVVFHPERVAENLQKQGGFIPGIRPGRPTSEYIMKTLNRITPAGAMFLSVIAVLPLLVQQMTGSTSLVVGGTSLLIVVSVAIEVVKQVKSQLTMREYEAM